MRLRTLFHMEVGIIALLGLLTAVALLYLSARLAGGVVTLKESVEKVGVAQNLQIDLLAYNYTSNLTWLSGDEGYAQAVSDIHQRLLDRLERAGSVFTEREEQEVIARLEGDIQQYLAFREAALAEGEHLSEIMRRGVEPLNRALAGIRGLTEGHVGRARLAREEAEALQQFASLWGTGAAIVFFLSAGVVVVLVRTQVHQPLLRIDETMARFHHGAGEARAPEWGPVELRNIAGRFNSLADSLQQQQENRLRFLAAVAHDLRNPLTAVKAYMQMLNMGGALPPEARLRQIFQLVNRQVDRIDRMIGDLLDATRIEAGKLELRLEVRDARDFVSDTAELFHAVSGQHVIETELPPEELVVECDPTRIEQVLNNLVSNALKYSPDGGRVTIGVRRVDDSAEFFVSDEGVGIPPEEQGAIFQPFRRAGNGEAEIPGVGLGLSVARRIVEAHGGAIGVDSTPGRGATFRVRLPLLAGRRRK